MEAGKAVVCAFGCHIWTQISRGLSALLITIVTWHVEHC